MGLVDTSADSISNSKTAAEQHSLAFSAGGIACWPLHACMPGVCACLYVCEHNLLHFFHDLPINPWVVNGTAWANKWGDVERERGKAVTRKIVLDIRRGKYEGQDLITQGKRNVCYTKAESCLETIGCIQVSYRTEKSEVELTPKRWLTCFTMPDRCLCISPGRVDNRTTAHEY